MRSQVLALRTTASMTQSRSIHTGANRQILLRMPTAKRVPTALVMGKQVCC